jgi:hypothetical protein
MRIKLDKILCRNSIKYLKILLLILFLCPVVKAQEDEVDFQFWVNYALSIQANQKLSYGGDVGFRGFISNADWNQILIRPTITYRFNYTFSAAGAVAWFRTFNVDDDNINEFRIHQDFNAKWPDFGFIEFFYRLRIEQRWFFYKSLPNDFDLRLRYLAGVESADINLFGPKAPIYFQLIYEGFRTVGDETAYEIFIDQRRFHVAIGQRISKKFRYELHYIRQKSRDGLDNAFELSQNIFRIRTFHTIPYKTKEIPPSDL